MIFFVGLRDQPINSITKARHPINRKKIICRSKYEYWILHTIPVEHLYSLLFMLYCTVVFGPDRVESCRINEDCCVVLLYGWVCFCFSFLLLCWIGLDCMKDYNALLYGMVWYSYKVV